MKMYPYRGTEGKPKDAGDEHDGFHFELTCSKSIFELLHLILSQQGFRREIEYNNGE